MRRLSNVILLAILLIGCSAKPATSPLPGEEGTASASSEQPLTPHTDSTSDAYFVTATAGAPQAHCPDSTTLVPTDESDKNKLLALGPNMIKELYTGPGYDEFINLSARMAVDAGVHGEMVKNWCGAMVANSTWVVGATFPKNAPSASLSGGQFMVAKTRKGWQVWFRYH